MQLNIQSDQLESCGFTGVEMGANGWSVDVVSGAGEGSFMRRIRGLTSGTILSIRAGTSRGILGHAHVCDGSVVRATLIGLTPQHAVSRAKKLVQRPAIVQIGMK